ncbi:MAG: hypothetical protein AB7Q17_01770 [Phycisphaerae bacterium]
MPAPLRAITLNRALPGARRGAPCGDPPASRGARFAATALLIALTTVGGCKRNAQTGAPPNATASQQEQQFIPAPAEPPAYSFAPGVRESQREIAGFVQQFLEVCLAGDYTGYRRLASRSREPETKERFQAIYHAMRNVVVEQIEEVELREIPGPAYRVVASIELDPQAKVALRGSQRQIALLIIHEGGDWRMLPAPASLQPPKAGEPQPPEEPEDPPAPDYPWDEDGDY